MQFLAICRRRTEAFSESDFASLLDAEAECVRAFYAEGFVRAAWGRDDVAGACLLLEAASVAQADAKLQTLPLASAGMLEVQLIPVRGYRGFGPRS